MRLLRCQGRRGLLPARVVTVEGRPVFSRALRGPVPSICMWHGHPEPYRRIGSLFWRGSRTRQGCNADVRASLTDRRERPTFPIQFRTNRSAAFLSWGRCFRFPGPFLPLLVCELDAVCSSLHCSVRRPLLSSQQSERVCCTHPKTLFHHAAPYPIQSQLKRIPNFLRRMSYPIGCRFAKKRKNVQALTATSNIPASHHLPTIRVPV